MECISCPVDGSGFSLTLSVCRQCWAVQASLWCPVTFRSFCAFDGQTMPGMPQHFTHFRCHWALLPSELGMLSEGSTWIFLAREGSEGQHRLCDLQPAWKKLL